MIKLFDRKISITHKLFFVTAVMFILFISVELLLQFAFIDKFYNASKIKSSTKALNEFCQDYVQNSWGKTELDNKTSYMSNTYNMQLAFLNAHGSNKYGGIEMTVRSNTGKDVCVDLHDVVLIDSLTALGMSTGKKISIKGWYTNGGIKLCPFKIDLGDIVWKRDDATINWDGMLQVDGTIEQLRIMDEDEYENSNPSYAALKSALEKWQENNIKLPDKRVIEEYKDDATGSRYKMFISPVLTKDGTKEAVFAIVPLQPVGEAVIVIKDYLVYIYLFALAVVLILSYIYSKMVAQPLIKINKAAVRMSNMDFSTKCKIHSSDELGSLSDSLNTMSSRLDSNITELKEFVSNASHEFKTPIAAMGGYIEALKDDIRKDKRDRYLNRLQFEVDKMNALVQGMLELSRMEAGNSELHKESFELQAVLNEIVEEFKSQASDKRICISVNEDQPPAIVFADRFKLGQVMANFISNALMHTPSNGKILIEISKSEKTLTLTVENEGEHIPEDKMGRIWERFYRAEASRARGNGGTGLGLAISAKILQLHNAQYGVRNTDLGVLFYFSLPN